MQPLGQHVYVYLLTYSQQSTGVVLDFPPAYPSYSGEIMDIKRRLIAVVTGFAVTFSGISVAHASSADSVASDFGLALQAASPELQAVSPELEDQVSIDSGVVSASTIDGKEVSLDLPDKKLESLGLDEYSTSPSGASIAVTDEGGGAFRSLIHIPNLESNG